jgi:hypothetical protein
MKSGKEKPLLNSRETIEVKIMDIKKNQAIITKDSIPDGEYNNKILTLDEEGTTRKRFRLYDDDEILYYSGYFYDDDECLNQMQLLDWGMYDSGCTIIKVAEGSEFIEEIC